MKRKRKADDFIPLPVIPAPEWLHEARGAAEQGLVSIRLGREDASFHMLCVLQALEQIEDKVRRYEGEKLELKKEIARWHKTLSLL